MERITYRITLDTHKNGIQRTLQGFETADNMARRIAVNLVAGSDTYEIPLDHVVAMVYVTTPSSTEPSINECIIEDNTIIYDVLPIVEEGITEMQIKLIETRANGAKSVLLAPRFAVEVAESGSDDSGAEQTTTFTSLENAISKAKEVYDSRLIRVEITEDCTFRAYYADGTFYENYYLHEALYNGNALLSESYAHGGTGIREGEDTDNSKYYSNISLSATKQVENISKEAVQILEQARLQTSFTMFDVDFESGELEYMSANYNFDVNEETGNLDVEGNGEYNPEKLIGDIVNDFIEEKSAEIDTKVEEVDSKVEEVNSKVDAVESIALGANQGLSYESYEAMITALNAMESTELHNGQNIHIGTLNVPDIWIYSVEDTSVEYSYVDDETLINALQSFPQIGYYRLSQLETQKVDLINYLSKDDILDTMEEVVANTQENKLAGALAIKELSVEVENCFQSVSDGKELVASAITDKGIATDLDATFATMAKNISLLSDTEKIIDSIIGLVTKASGTSSAIATATLEANSKYLVIAVSSGSTGYSYNNNAYVNQSWHFSGTNVSFTGGKATLTKEQQPTAGTYDGIVSYKVYCVETESEEVTVNASANCINFQGTTAANYGSTMQCLFTVKLS